MKKRSAWSFALALACIGGVIGGCENNSEQQYVGSTRDSDDGIASTEETGKMPSEEQIYDEHKHFDILHQILRMESGRANPDMCFFRIAAAYCHRSSVSVPDDCWRSEGICHEWLISLIGQIQYEQQQLYNRDLAGYLEGDADDVLDVIVPNREVAKENIKEYCHSLALTNRSVDNAYRYGAFDRDAFEYLFDGLYAYDWFKANWRKHIKVNALSICQNAELTNDTIDVYDVRFRYVFEMSKRHQEKPHDDIDISVKLFESATGEYYYHYEEELD